MHTPQGDLQDALKTAAEKVEVGALYHHYKNLTDTYKVVKLAITEWDDQICVIYEAQYGENLTFVRPLESWLEQVEWNGQKVDRFTPKQD